MADTTADTAALPQTVLRRLIKRRLALFGFALIVIVLAGAVLATWIAPYAPDEQLFDGLTLEGAPLPPDARFIMGTDLLGRDLFSRILYGAQTSLVIGVVANSLALLIGTLVGITAGFFRGWIGAALMRFTDMMMAFPALLLAICLAAIFKPSLWIVALVIALVNWVQTARVIYTETTSLATRDFIAAERTLGASTGRILFIISCRIWCPPSSSGARWAFPRPCYLRRRCPFLASACSPLPQAGAT